MNEDDYKVNAVYYDGVYNSLETLIDISFYLEEAKRSGGPVLELGCGTGRVSRVIARSEIEVVGADPIGSIYYNYHKDKTMIEPHTYFVEGIGEDMLCPTV